MYNWKFSSAFTVAQAIPNFPLSALEILKKLHAEHGNIGWVDAAVSDNIRDLNNEVAHHLNLQWAEVNDTWAPDKK
jgi:hypothetical protein